MACFIIPHLVHKGQALGVDAAFERLGTHGCHGAIDENEGIIWRVQRRGQVDFLVKYVKPHKVDGIYLPEISGQGPVWNWYPYGYHLDVQTHKGE